VEVLGTSSLLTCYDLKELLFPRVAPRAVLPKMFRKAREDAAKGDGCPQRHPKIKTSAPHAHADDAVVANLTAALWQLDPLEWRGEYDAWFQLATACRFLGIDRADFVAWSVSDPHYAADARLIERIWDSAKPAHGGALFAALKGAGIKVTERAHKSASPSLYLEVHLTSTTTAKSRDWRSRFNSILSTLRPTERSLFCVACMVAELMAELGKPKPSVAMQLLEGECRGNGLWRMLGPDEVKRTITNGFRWVEEKLLTET
jgi:Primase C terminal 2 (PriCT-2)